LRGDIMAVARSLESEPSILGASPHLLAIGRKPDKPRMDAADGRGRQ
jgi:hypothetical protein